MATMAMKAKLRECSGCNLPFIEMKEEEISRKIKKAKCLCGNCQYEWEQYKLKKKIPALSYLGEDEPLPFDLTDEMN